MICKDLLMISFSISGISFRFDVIMWLVAAFQSSNTSYTIN